MGTHRAHLKTKNASKSPATRLNTDELPSEPGYGLVESGRYTSAREAMFRADYLREDQAEALFEQYGRFMPPMDDYTVRDLPDYYHRYSEIAGLKQLQLQADVEGDQALHRQVTDQLNAIFEGLGDEDDIDDASDDGSTSGPAAVSGMPEIPQLPGPPALQVIPGGGDDLQEPPPGLEGDKQIQVWQAIAAGCTRWSRLQVATGIADTTLNRILQQLEECGHIDRPERGVYVPTTSPDPADD